MPVIVGAIRAAEEGGAAKISLLAAHSDAKEAKVNFTFRFMPGVHSKSLFKGGIN